MISKIRQVMSFPTRHSTFVLFFTSFFSELTNTFGLELHDIDSISGNVPASSQFSLVAPITRMPPLGASALPYCIDHATSDGCISLVRAYWPDLVTDHAAIGACAKVGKLSSPHFATKA